jgi:hypothetical protein
MIIQSDKSEMLINDKGEYVMTINKCMKWLVKVRKSSSWENIFFKKKVCPD